MQRWLIGVAALLSLTRAAAGLHCSSTAPPSRTTYDLDVVVSAQAPQIRGHVRIQFCNRSRAALSDVTLLLFPNRFASADHGVDDINRPYVYPYEEFDPGWMRVGAIRVNGQAASTRPIVAPHLPAAGAIAVALAEAAPSGSTIDLWVEFETFVPTRFGTFGKFEGMLTALGGWYPYLAPLHDDGVWGVNEAPELSDFALELKLEAAMDVVLNGHFFAAANPPPRLEVPGVHYLSLIAAPHLQRDGIEAGETHVTFLHRPEVRSDRRSFGPSQLQITLAALRDIVLERPAGATPPPREIVIVEAPLRLNLTADGEGMVVISDRAMKLNWLLRPFHQAQLAQAVYAELLRPPLAAREPAADFPWVSEGLAHELARDYLQASHSDTRSVQDWIELFNIFAIVDRFESAPKIPFVDAYFERARHADALHEQITTFNNDLPPGHVVLGKLRQQLGDAEFKAVIDRCRDGSQPFRECTGSATEQNTAALFNQWLQPYPEVNYEIEHADLNRTSGDGYGSDVVVGRQASRPLQEPVDVQLRSIGGRSVDLRWDGTGAHGRLTAQTPFRVHQVRIDPQRKLIETTRADNARPSEAQLVVDTAEVEISSTEFGFSALMVGRRRYDYGKDLAAAGVFTNRGIGVAVGPRLHWGEPNDPTLYRNNFFLFYSVQALDRSFKDDRHPEVRTTGHSNGVGWRYNYNDIVAFDNPTKSIDVRLFADWFDRGMGSDYSYADWGGSIAATHPLWTHRTILAGQVLNGFSQPLGSSRVPNQGLFSLGGSRSIRGIGAEEELGRNIFLVRSELRQAIFPEVDLNLLDTLVLRRVQLRGFVETGQVSNSAGQIYDPNGYAVGVGVGFAWVYEFMGFFPSLAYIELATRADADQGEVQFLFGTRQAF